MDPRRSSRLKPKPSSENGSSSSAAAPGSRKSERKSARINPEPPKQGQSSSAAGASRRDSAEENAPGNPDLLTLLNTSSTALLQQIHQSVCKTPEPGAPQVPAVCVEVGEEPGADEKEGATKKVKASTRSFPVRMAPPPASVPAPSASDTSDRQKSQDSRGHPLSAHLPKTNARAAPPPKTPSLTPVDMDTAAYLGAIGSALQAKLASKMSKGVDIGSRQTADLSMFVDNGAAPTSSQPLPNQQQQQQRRQREMYPIPVRIPPNQIAAARVENPNRIVKDYLNSVVQLQRDAPKPKKVRPNAPQFQNVVGAPSAGHPGARAHGANMPGAHGVPGPPSYTESTIRARAPHLTRLLADRPAQVAGTSAPLPNTPPSSIANRFTVSAASHQTQMAGSSAPPPNAPSSSIANRFTAPTARRQRQVAGPSERPTQNSIDEAIQRVLDANTPVQVIWREQSPIVPKDARCVCGAQMGLFLKKSRTAGVERVSPTYICRKCNTTRSFAGELNPDRKIADSERPTPRAPGTGSVIRNFDEEALNVGPMETYRPRTSPPRAPTDPVRRHPHFGMPGHIPVCKDPQHHLSDCHCGCVASPEPEFDGWQGGGAEEPMEMEPMEEEPREAEARRTDPMEMESMEEEPREEAESMEEPKEAEPPKDAEPMEEAMDVEDELMKILMETEDFGYDVAVVPAQVPVPAAPAESASAPAAPAKPAPAAPVKAASVPAAPAKPVSVEPASVPAAPAKPVSVETAPTPAAQTKPAPAAPVKAASVPAAPAKPVSVEPAPTPAAQTKPAPAAPAESASAPAAPAKPAPAAPVKAASVPAAPAKPVSVEPAPTPAAQTKPAPTAPAESAPAPPAALAKPAPSAATEPAPAAQAKPDPAAQTKPAPAPAESVALAQPVEPAPDVPVAPVEPAPAPAAPTKPVPAAPAESAPAPPAATAPPALVKPAPPAAPVEPAPAPAAPAEPAPAAAVAPAALSLSDYFQLTSKELLQSILGVAGRQVRDGFNWEELNQISAKEFIRGFEKLLSGSAPAQAAPAAQPVAPPALAPGDYFVLPLKVLMQGVIGAIGRQLNDGFEWQEFDEMSGRDFIQGFHDLLAVKSK